MTHDPDNSIEYSCPPTLPEENVVDVVLDITGGPESCRSELTEELESRGYIDHGQKYATALAMFLSSIAGTRVFPRRPGTHRALAYCGLMLINRCELSESEVAKLCGVSKSDISRWKRDMEERWGVESAGVRRSREARGKFSETAARVEEMKRKAKRKEARDWNRRFQQ